MAKWIKNADTSTHTYQGQSITAGSYYQIQPIEDASWSNDSSLLADIASGIAVVAKDDSGTNDITDLNQAILWLKGSLPISAETGGAIFSPKYAPDGWTEQIFETEWETSKLNSIHEKDWENNDIGWSSLKFYDAAGNELTTQASIDTDCVRTDLEWMPNKDYMIKGGWVGQIVAPTVDIYVWVLAAVLPAQYGGPQALFCDGGLNMQYQDARSRTGLDGVSGTILNYTHPQLGAGAGTNKIVYITRHPAGHKHRLQAIFDIFAA